MKAKKLTIMALLLGLALIIFIIEAQLPPLAPIPGIKLGLSNIITLIAVYILGRKEAFVILVLRIMLASIFSGGMAGFLYSIAGGMVCFLFMGIASIKLGEGRMWVVSVLGAIGHNIGQIIVACVVIGSGQVLWYLPVLMISAVLTGVFTGIAAQVTLRQLRKSKILKERDNA